VINPRVVVTDSATSQSDFKSFSLQMGAHITMYLNALKFDKNRSFKITPENIYSVVEAMNTALGWFDIADLFVLTDEDELILNAKYSEYEVRTRDKNAQGVLSLRPAVLRQDALQHEAVLVAINLGENADYILREDLGNIMYALKTFSFSEEINLAMNLMMYTKIIGIPVEHKTF
jgi:hypothetical protein